MKLGTLKELGLSSRICSYLKKIGIISLDELEQITETDIINIRKHLGKSEAEKVLSIIGKTAQDISQFVMIDESNPEEIKLEDLAYNGMISSRTYNCLCRSGKYTLGDVASCTTDEMIRIRNLGKKSLEQIQEVLEKYDLSLRT